MKFHRMTWCSATLCGVERSNRTVPLTKNSGERLRSWILPFYLPSFLSTFQPAHTVELRMERCGSTLITRYPAPKVTFFHLFCFFCLLLLLFTLKSIKFQFYFPVYIRSTFIIVFSNRSEILLHYAGALDRHRQIHKTRQRREQRCRIRGWQY